MNYLYLILDLGSLSVPLLFSFHPRLSFHKKWPALAKGLLVMMAFFIPWDIWFTAAGYWGFNPDYLTGINLLGLPIEEWLFFICIPYACIFTHYALPTIWPNFRLSARAVDIGYVLLQSVLIVTLWYHYDNWYTLVNFMYAIILLGMVYQKNRELLQGFATSYLVILIPFFLVNGALTGGFTSEPVVWYNDSENLGIRVGTIPVEDLIYNLGMLLTVLFVMEGKNNTKETLSQPVK